MFSKLAYSVFEQSIKDYHQFDNVDQPISNPFPKDKFEHLLYHKNWIDTVQWHFEDIIRDPNIDPVAALTLKRRIDASNQERTDMVEYIDSYFLQKYSHVKVKDNAKINSESPAWAFDRLFRNDFFPFFTKQRSNFSSSMVQTDTSSPSLCRRKVIVGNVAPSFARAISFANGKSRNTPTKPSPVTEPPLSLLSTGESTSWNVTSKEVIGFAHRLRSATKGSVSCPELAVMTGSALLHWSVLKTVAAAFEAESNRTISSGWGTIWLQDSDHFCNPSKCGAKAAANAFFFSSDAASI